MNLLLAEDEPNIANVLQRHLQLEGFSVTVARNGIEAERLLQSGGFSLLLLDWRMPLKSGLQLCTELRAAGNAIPIIMITALADTLNKVDALQAGADDYITKPFAIEEVMARINALLRRTTTQRFDISAGALQLQPLTHTILCGGTAVKLPEKEFALLAFLVQRKNEVVSRETLHEQVWGISFSPSTNLVDVTIKNLRKHLAELTPCKCIKSIYGEGYVFIPF